MSPEAPTAAELEQHPVVQAAFAAAWADSLPDDSVLRHEEGGYIYVDLTGAVLVRRAPPGGRWQIDLSSPPGVPGCFLVATYHTHPTPIAEGGNPDPSPDDLQFGDESGVPWFVVSELGIVAVGPNHRVGGLTGPGGYPQ
jgi:hypothetical protein